MRKAKYGFWLILLVLLGIVFWQNQSFFLTPHAISVNYGVGVIETPELQLALYFLIFFLAGLLLSYFSSLFERFLARKQIRKLNEALAGAQKQISDLESALAARDLAASDAASAASVEPPMPPGEPKASA